MLRISRIEVDSLPECDLSTTDFLEFLSILQHSNTFVLMINTVKTYIQVQKPLNNDFSTVNIEMSFDSLKSMAERISANA